MNKSNDHATQRHQRLAELFEQAVEIPVHQRDAFVQRSCADDVQLRDEVMALLANDERAAAVDRPVIDLKSGAAAVILGTAQPIEAPARIARYEIIDVLGTGGMGTVYRARQENPNRVVALKVIRPGMTSPAMIRRFDFEAHLLGRLQHPGIAQIYEAGTFDVGHGAQPYFAMEHIKGEPLLAHAKQSELDVRQRLEMIAKVCDAVQHAHQKGIVHRDLKPGNVLVDAAGQPKILDFGIARATDADLQVNTMPAERGQLVGTLPYMSPEQAAGRADEVDVRSDVYSLGVMAFELLSGKLPHDLENTTMLGAAKIICESTPTRLGAINPALRGDVETIISKALEKEKSRRYQSASELSDDLRRYLRDEPIVARPASAVYQLRKFAQRNRALVGGAITALVLLIVAVIGTSTGLVIAQRERDDARRAAQKAEAVRQFFLGVLTTPVPEAAGREVTVVEALRRSEQAIADAFPDQPEILGDVHSEMAVTFAKLGDMQQAEHHAREALRVRIQTLGHSHPDTISTKNNLASILLQPGRRQQPGAWHEADALLNEAIASATTEHADHPEYLIDPLNNMAYSAFQNNLLDEAEQLTRQVLEISIKHHGEKHLSTIAQRQNLAILLRYRGEFDEARRELRNVVQQLNEQFGPRHPSVLNAQQSLADTLAADVKLDEAAQLYRDILPTFREVMGSDHPSTIILLNQLGTCLKTAKRFPESAQTFREALGLARSKLGDTDFTTISIKDSLAKVLIELGQFDESARLSSEILEPLRTQFRPTSREALGTAFQLADALICAGRHAEALVVCKENLEFIVGAPPPREDAALATNLRAAQARAAHGLGRTEDAAAGLAQCVREYQQMTKRDDFLTQSSLESLAKLSESIGQPETAASLRNLAPMPNAP